MTRAASQYLAEAIGTFALVFVGTGAIVVADVTGGTIPHLGVAMTFGLIVMAVIYAIGEVSGAHINPAVTVGLCVAVGAKEQGIMAGAAIGATVGLAALFGGPISGASMNPARSLAPAVAALNYSHLWLYLVAPLFGAALAVVAYSAVYTVRDDITVKNSGDQ